MRPLRSLRPLLAAVALACLAAPVTAQGCVQTDPCSIVADVTETGFGDPRDVNATVGDWYVLETSNDLDSRTHTVTLADFGVSLTVAQFEEKASQPFELKAAHVGTHTIKDAPTGATMVFRVLSTDAVDHDAGLDDTSSGAGTASSRTRAPGLEAPVLLAAVAGLGLLLRRRA